MAISAEATKKQNENHAAYLQHGLRALLDRFVVASWPFPSRLLATSL
jgi:hypothetical protein